MKTQELTYLKEYSKQNNFIKVNTCVKSFLVDQKFWILCHESNKNNIKKKNIFIKNLEVTLLFNLKFFQIFIGVGIKSNFICYPTYKNSKFQYLTVFIDVKYFINEIIIKGISIILEELSEYRFKEFNFGYRKTKTYLNGLNYIRKKKLSNVLSIRVNLSKCFSCFSYKKIISLIKKKYLNQHIFINLLYKIIKFRKILSVNVNNLYANSLRTSQNFSLNSLLINILLHELDVFINQIKQFIKIQKVKPFVFLNFWKYKKINSFKLRSNKLNYWNFSNKLKVLSNFRFFFYQKQQQVFKDNQIVYIRYLNDLIFFIKNKNKNNSTVIKNFLKNFLKNELAINLVEKKIQFKNLNKEKVEFLGFQIWEKIWINKKKIKSSIKKVSKNFKKIEQQIAKIKIKFNIRNIFIKLVIRNLLVYIGKTFLPISYKHLLIYNIVIIIAYISAIFYELTNYYGASNNWYNSKFLYNYFGKCCTAMTIGHKIKIKVNKVFQNYGLNLTIKQSNTHMKIVSYSKII